MLQTAEQAGPARANLDVHDLRYLPFLDLDSQRAELKVSFPRIGGRRNRRKLADWQGEMPVPSRLFDQFGR